MCMMSLFSSYYIAKLGAKYYNFKQNIEHNKARKKNCQKEHVDILISKNQVLRILYPSSIIPCMIIINFIVYNDTVLQCYTQTYLI